MAASDPFYNELVNETVIPVIEEFGAEFTIRSPGQYDEATLTTGAESQRTAFGLVATGQIAAAMREAGVEITSTRNLLLVPSANVQPEDEVFVDGKWFPFTNVESIKPADIIVLYILDLTR